MEKFSDELNFYYSRVCKFLKRVLEEDDGVDNFCSPQYADKARNALMKDNWLVVSGIFGVNTLLGIMEFLARNEKYEVCITIRDYIGEINKNRVKNPLPKSLKEVQESC